MRKKRLYDSPFIALLETGWSLAEGGCWEWNGWTAPFGHGGINLANRHYMAHRIAYEWWVEPIPKGLIVRHKCDNPPCVNPAHLELGTHADNSRDMWSRGRAYRQNTVTFKCGHPKTDAYVRRDGTRRCRVCTNEANRRAHVRRKAAMT